jgi:hypothetical protein
MTFFNPRYHGSVFTVFYTSDPTIKSTIKCHLITSPDHLELISQDYKQSFQKWTTTDIESVSAAKNIVTVTLKAGDHSRQILFNTTPEPSEGLVAALSTVTSIAKPEVRSLTLQTILPSFRLGDQLQANYLSKTIQDHSIALIQYFQISKDLVNTVNQPLADILGCLLRARYPNEAVQQTDRCLRELIQEVKRYILILWCNGIAECAQSPSLATAKIYYSRLALHCSRTVVKASSSLGIPVKDVVQLVENFADQSGATYEGLDTAARAVAKLAKDQMDAEAAKVPPVDPANLVTFQNLVVLALCANLVGMYQPDVESLAAKAVDLAKALLNKAPADEPRKSLQRYVGAFVRDLLRFLDGLRYDEPFQFIYCTWQLGTGERED